MDEGLDHIESEEKKRNPLWYVMAAFLAVIVIATVVPYYSINKDPKPSEAISLSEAVQGLDFNESLKLQNIEELSKQQVTPSLKTVSNRIAGSCEVSKVCYAKAFFYFVRDEINYITDPNFEYIESAELVLESGSADCDGKSSLLSGLLKSVGINSRIVVGNNHAFVQAYLPDALKSYKTENDWVSLDTTCTSCEFGEVSGVYLRGDIDFVYVY